MGAVDQVLDSSEAQARACIDSWTDGTYSSESIMDDDGHGIENIHVRATVTVKGDSVSVDLSDSDPQVKGIVNSSYANTVSSVHYAIAYLIEPQTPKNSGTFRPITVTTKEGTVVHPFPPAPVTLSTNHPSQEIAEAVIKALSEACPDRVIAGWGKRYRIAMTGRNPRNGKPFIWHLFHARPGAGASAYGDGWSNIGELASGGGLKFGPIEVMEARFPLFFRRHEFRPNSAGRGRYRGGFGVSLEMRIETEEPLFGVLAGEGKVHPPYGLFGGESGKPHSYSLVSAKDGSVTDLKTKAVGVPIGPGDTLLVESAGGGGYGDPSLRTAEATARDIANDLVIA
jgi:N-methylhydantoinase B